MRFLISPSKTMQKTKSCEGGNILFPDMRRKVLQHLKLFSLDDLGAYYGVNRDIAEVNYARLHDFKEDNIAIHAYTGQQFKHLNATGLSHSQMAYLDDHLVILSAMYGAVRPHDCIGLYRLPMALKMDGTRLSILWRDILVPHFKGETLINLASAEYADALKGAPMLTVDFLIPTSEGFKRAPAMEAKKLRGLFVRRAAIREAGDTESLKAFDIEGYTYSEAASDAVTLAFTKAE